MPRYSIYEQRLIREKLLGEGSTLREMFSTELTQNAKLEIVVDSEHENHTFKYFSDSHNVNRAVEEVVNLVKFIKSLEREDLVRKHFTASTSLYDFDEEDCIEIGESRSKASAKFLLPINSTDDIVAYLYGNLDKRFKATAELRALVENNFELPDDKRHKEVMKQTRTANKISLYSFIAAIIAVCVSIFQGSSVSGLENQIKKNDDVNLKLREKLKIDSLANSSLQQEVQILKKFVNSLKSVQKK